MKYSDDELRDEQGQWTEGGASGSAKPVSEHVPTLPTPSAMVLSSEPKDWSRSSRAAENYLLSKSDELTSKLSQDEIDSLFAYTKSARINDRLREGGLSSSDEKDISLLDTAISKGMLDQDTVLYRGLESMPDGMKEGSVFTDNGFVSTSLRKDVSQGFGDTLIKIIGKAGSHGAFLAGDLTSSFDLYEVLLPRGSQFQITKIEPSYGGTTIWATVL